MRSTKTQTTLRRMKKNLLHSADMLLTEMAGGVRKTSAAELKQLSDVMERERPSADHIMTTLVNQYSYLREGFEATPQEYAIINEFLHDFQREAALDRLARETDISDGLKLQEGMQ